VRFRAYLHILAEVHLGKGGRAGIEPSDVVQQTLLDAHRGLEQFRGGTEAEMAAWLRRLLACNLTDAQRARRRAKRDAGREVSLERSLDESSVRMASFLAANQSSPSRRAERVRVLGYPYQGTSTHGSGDRERQASTWPPGTGVVVVVNPGGSK
jgi:RNA polymerase sigma-70 factor (ECF subfamily)